jgi:hypothetical protein
VPDIVLYTLVSLDGATADPHRHFPETGDKYGAPVFDEEPARLEGRCSPGRVPSSLAAARVGYRLGTRVTSRLVELPEILAA